MPIMHGVNKNAVNTDSGVSVTLTEDYNSEHVQISFHKEAAVAYRSISESGAENTLGGTE